MARELCEDKSRNTVSSAGFCYTDVSPSNHPSNIQNQFNNQIQGFVSNPEMFNLTTGMEMIGFSKNLQQQQSSTDSANTAMWKGFFGNKHHQPAGPSSSKTTMINEPTTTSSADFYNQHQHDQFSAKPSDFTAETSSENLIVGPPPPHHEHDESGPWGQENRFLVDDSSLRCVFPCEGNERPSQGLSLSLSSSNPSSIGLQSFELRHSAHHHHPQPQDDMRFGGFFGKSSPAANMQQIQDGFLGKVSNPHHQQGHGFQLRNSKYLNPAQELLNEFCSLGIKQSDINPPKQKPHKAKQWEDDNGGTSSSSSRKQPLCSLEFMELQKRKTELLSMLEKVYMFF